MNGHSFSLNSVDELNRRIVRKCSGAPWRKTSFCVYLNSNDYPFVTYHILFQRTSHKRDLKKESDKSAQQAANYFAFPQNSACILLLIQ